MPTSRVTPRQAQDAHRAGRSRPSARRPTDAPRRRAARSAAARFVRSVRARAAAARGLVAASARASPPRPARSSGRRPAAGRRSSSRRIAAAPFRSAGSEPLAPRAEMGRPRADDDPLDRPAAARARLAGPLVDLQALLHRAVAVGRGVVVDRAAAPLDRLGQDRPDRLVQAALVGGPERPGRPQRVEPRRPQRLVGVDVADAGEERLVEQQRLEPARSAAAAGAGSRAR